MSADGFWEGKGKRETDADGGEDGDEAGIVVDGVAEGVDGGLEEGEGGAQGRDAVGVAGCGHDG